MPDREPGRAVAPVDHLRTPAVASDEERFRLLLRKAGTLAKSPLVPDDLKGKPEAIVQVALWGQEHGVPLSTSLSSVYVVGGRPFPSAQLGLALIRRAGHDVRFVESSSERATIRGRRREDAGDPDGWVEVTWTIQDAERVVVKTKSGSYRLVDKDVWKSYPAAMLRARAASDLVRMHFSDVLAALGVDEFAPDDGIAGWTPEAAPYDDDDVAEPELIDQGAGADEPADADEVAVCSEGVPGCDIDGPHPNGHDRWVADRARGDEGNDEGPADAPPSMAAPDVAGWDAARWRDEVRNRGARLGDALRRAIALADERGEDRPTAIEDLSARPELAAALLAELDQ